MLDIIIGSFIGSGLALTGYVVIVTTYDRLRNRKPTIQTGEWD